MRLIPFVFFALAACGQPADGHRFERKEFERSRPDITIVLHPSVADLRAAAPPSARHKYLRGWSVITRTGCELHVVDPAASYRPEWLGHEVAHCVWGRFHP